MEYEWVTDNRVYELREVTHARVPSPTYPKMWDSYYPLGRLRKLKNRISCKKFALERYAHGRWEYITLLCMKLDEAKQIARTILIAGANND
jgi:hypothetical protein